MIINFYITNVQIVDSKNMKINKKIHFFPLKILCWILYILIVYFNCIDMNVHYNYRNKILIIIKFCIANIQTVTFENLQQNSF